MGEGLGGLGGLILFIIQKFPSLGELKLYWRRDLEGLDSSIINYVAIIFGKLKYINNNHSFIILYKIILSRNIKDFLIFSSSLLSLKPFLPLPLLTRKHQNHYIKVSTWKTKS